MSDAACGGEESFQDEAEASAAAANPQACLVCIQRVGHWVPLDNPRGFLEVVAGFLTGE